MRKGLIGLLATVLVAAGCSALPDFSRESEAEVVASDWDLVAEGKTHEVPIAAIAFNSDGNLIASGHYDWRPSDERQSPMFVDPQLPLQLWRVESEFLRNLASVNVFPARRLSYVAETQQFRFDSHGEVFSWNTRSLKFERKRIAGVQLVSPSGMLVAIRDDREDLLDLEDLLDVGELWDPIHEVQIREMRPNSKIHTLRHDGDHSPLDISQDDTRVATMATDIPGAGSATELIVWDLESDKPLARRLVDGSPWSVQFSADGKRLGFVLETKKVLVWNLDSLAGRKILKYQFPKAVRPYGITFSPNGRFLAACAETDDGGEVRVWDVATGKKVASIVDESVWAFTAVAFSPDGTRLATGDSDGRLRLWAVPDELQVR